MLAANVDEMQQFRQQFRRYVVDGSKQTTLCNLPHNSRPFMPRVSFGASFSFSSCGISFDIFIPVIVRSTRDVTVPPPYHGSAAVIPSDWRFLCSACRMIEVALLKAVVVPRVEYDDLCNYGGSMLNSEAQHRDVVPNNYFAIMVPEAMSCRIERRLYRSRKPLYCTSFMSGARTAVQHPAQHPDVVRCSVV